MTGIGLVSLVGAGPGDPELITVRGLARLRAADTVVYDRLVDPRLVAEAPAAAERIFVGKAAGYAALAQADIEALLIARARAGRRVVRLKGGDPFVFGRGGEEVEALVAAGVPVEVVPGVTSAFAAPASAGIPVTHRGLASAVTIVTGHDAPDKAGNPVDWDWLAAANGTLVVLMGLGQLRQICDRLVAGGRDAATPAAVIAAGTWADQRVVEAPLGALADAVAAAPIVAPALIVVGDVVGVRATIAPSALVGPALAAADAPNRESRIEPEPARFAPVAQAATSASAHIGDGHD
ncbi:MAG TPA: uroporphyrinogen-III C-methyltransferase [Thermomicrobiales bacterium]|jgi:uroporphyrin-III C-methyltransferase|nr:uroporphyrinogen-III C-methyltransferase [Thermomicrobiales bacterium]